MQDTPPSGGGSLKAWLRIAVSLAVLTFLALRLDMAAVGRLLGAARLSVFGGLLLVNLSAYLLMALRWGTFCRALGLPGGLRDHLRGVFLFQVTSQVVPSPWIGEAGRFASFPSGTPRKEILKSILLDRLSNQIALALCVLLFLPYLLRLEYPRWFHMLLPVPAVVLALAWVLARRIPGEPAGQRRSWRDRLRFLTLLGDGRAGLPLAIGIALSLLLGLEFYVASLVLPAEAAPLGIVFLVPLLLTVLSLLPISFGDWGTREVCALFVLAPTGLSSEFILTTSLLVGLANSLCSLPGLFWIARGRRG